MSAHALATGHHRHRRLQESEPAASSAGDPPGSRPMVPHAPQELTSLALTEDGRDEHAGANLLLHASEKNQKDRVLKHVDSERDAKQGGQEHSNHIVQVSSGSDKQHREQGAMSIASAGALTAFRTPKLASTSSLKYVSTHNGNTGLTQNSHATWVADSIRQSVTGALDQAMEALEAELARKLPGRLQSGVHASGAGESGVRGVLPGTTDYQPARQETSVRTNEVSSQLDKTDRVQLSKSGSGCGDL
jgi:hypothetical protein